MPFTTYHLGSALLIGYVLRKKVCWAALLICSVFVVDVEPIAVVVTRTGDDLHGYAHTFVASLALGALVGFVLYFARGYVKLLLSDLGLCNYCDSLRSYVLGGIVGWFIHVLMDAPIYHDIKPFRPYSENIMYIPQYSGELYALYGLIFYAGSALYLTYTHGVSYSNRTPGTARVLTGLVALGLGSTALPIKSMDMYCAFLVLTLIGVYLVIAGLSIIFSSYRLRLRAALAFSIISITLFSTTYTQFINELASLASGVPPEAISIFILLSYVSLLAAVAIAYPVIRDAFKISRSKLFRYSLVSLVAGLSTALISIGIVLVFIGYLGLLFTSRRVLADIEERHSIALKPIS